MVLKLLLDLKQDLLPQTFTATVWNLRQAENGFFFKDLKDITRTCSVQEA